MHYIIIIAIVVIIAALAWAWWSPPPVDKRAECIASAKAAFDSQASHTTDMVACPGSRATRMDFVHGSHMLITYPHSNGTSDFVHVVLLKDLTWNQIEPVFIPNYSAETPAL